MSRTLSPSMLQDAWDAEMFGLSSMSACAWICNDTIIAMDQEIVHIWRAQLSSAKMLYILARYVTVAILIFLAITGAADSLPDSVCRSWPSIAGAAIIVAGVSVDLIQILRVRAVFLRNRRVTIPLYLFFAGIFLTAVVIIRTSPPASKVVQPKTKFVVGCTNNAKSIETVAAWVAELVLGGVFLLLTVARLYPQLKGRAAHTDLAATIVQGGVIFSTVIFVTELFNTVYLQVMANSDRQNLLNITLPVGTCCIRNRGATSVIAPTWCYDGEIANKGDDNTEPSSISSTSQRADWFTLSEVAA
ncbi:hypothetical protein CALCODRAFT_123708 [Calocera cornea HHB12733]|uniref:DUF6533 domain-containing protein n=1 Tax=Calocera cornea HHB12733 TaxID=1353952 RepID=A0A165CY47_9BASI|nr:hypothetical protein CALCODRAFT_123708 [Calocera cornea HHB12733]